MKRSSENVYVDAATVKGELFVSKAQIQIAAIPELPMDLDQVVTRSTRFHHINGAKSKESSPRGILDLRMQISDLRA